jgi:hypothetical protein
MKKCVIVLALIACSSIGTIGGTMAKTTVTDTQDKVGTTPNTNNSKTEYRVTFTVNKTTDSQMN